MTAPQRDPQRGIQPTPTPRWTACTWALHLRGYHPLHVAATYAAHRGEMPRGRVTARIMTALAMEGQRVISNSAPLTYEQALELIDAACVRREAKRAA
ncbi:MAG: hypothetical protein Q8Q09_07760 [Deltaproteobacteria bacterium]|nr:hypothetical protein [Deltaproteobacteria bacterium]